MLSVRNTIKALFNPFSSSAPEVKHERESSVIEHTNDDPPVPEDMAGLSPNHYEDAAEELSRIDLTPPPPAKQKDKSAKRTKKAKKSKQTQQVDEPDVDDLDLSSHFEKIGSIAAGLAGEVTDNMEVDGAEEVSQPVKKKRRSGGLSKRDLIMMEENQRNGYLPEEAEAMADTIPEVLELPAKIKKAKKSKKKSLDRTATPPISEDDVESLLQQQLSPAKTRPVENFSQELPDLSMDGVVQEEGDINVAATSANAQKKKKKKRTLSDLQGEVPSSKKKSKRSRIEDASNGEIHAVLSSQPVVQALDNFARKSKASLAEERSSPPPRSRNFEIIVPSSPAQILPSRAPILPPKFSKKAATERLTKPAKKSKSKAAVVNDIYDIPSSESEPAKGGMSEEEPENSEEEYVPEAEPELQSDDEMPPEPKSSERKKRRMPVDVNDEESASKHLKPASRKSIGNNPSKATASQKSLTPAPKTGKTTPQDTILIDQTIQNYRDEYDLDQESLFEIIHDNASKKDSKAAQFWINIWSEVPHLPRRNVQSYVRRGYHSHRKDPWTEEDDNDLDMVYHQVKEKQSLTVGFWKTIGKALDRYSEDCRDRWRTYSSCKNRNIGPWSQVEEERLREAMDSVKKENRKAIRKINRGAEPGSKTLLEDPEPNWMEVAKKMGGTRTRLQCLNKWQNLCVREDANGDDRVALAPVSQTPWRARPALQEAQAMGLQEKVQLLSLISGSGAAREGKIPWRSFPDSKGNVLVWKTFLRGVLYSVPADEDTTFQDRISYLLDKHEAREPVEFDVTAAEFEALKLSRKSPSKKSAVTPRVVESEDSVDGEEAEELPKTFRQRMKKDGESQETVNVEHGDDSDENISDVLAEIRNSGTKASKSLKGAEKVTDSPESSLNDDNDFPASSYLVTKSLKAKKDKQRRKSEDVIMEDVEEEFEDEEPLQPAFTSDMMQIDNEDVPEDLPEDVSSPPAATAHATKKKSKKSKKPVHTEESLEAADVDLQSADERRPKASSKKSKKAKRTTLTERPEEHLDGAEQPVNAVIEEPLDETLQEEVEVPKEKKKKKSKKAKKATLAEEAEELLDEIVDQSLNAYSEELLDEPLQKQAQAPLLNPSEDETPKEKKKKKKSKKSKKTTMPEDPMSALDQDIAEDSHQAPFEEFIQEQDETLVAEAVDLDAPARKKKKTKKAGRVSDIKRSLENLAEDSTLPETIAEQAAVDLFGIQTSKKKKRKKSKDAVVGPLELEEDPIEDFAEPLMSDAAPILPPPSKKKKSKKPTKEVSTEEPNGEQAPLPQEDIPAEEGSLLHDDAGTPLPPPSKKKKSKKSKKISTDLDGEPAQRFVEDVPAPEEPIAMEEPSRKKKKSKKEKRAELFEASEIDPFANKNDLPDEAKTAFGIDSSSSKKSKKPKKTAPIENPFEELSQLAHEEIITTARSSEKKKKPKSASPIPVDLPDVDTQPEAGSDALDEMIARKLNQRSRRVSKDDPYLNHNLSDDSDTLEAMLSRKLKSKRSRGASQDLAISNEHDNRADSPHGTTIEPFSDSYTGGVESYQSEGDAEFDVKNDDIEVGSPFHEHIPEEYEPQEEYPTSDQGSVDLDQTENIIEARSFNESTGQELSDNDVAEDNNDDLDDEPRVIIHHGFQNSDSLRDGSPILEGTPREIRESSVPIPREVTPEKTAKETKRKRTDASSDQKASKKKKKKKKINVSRAQHQWENLQPPNHRVNGFTPINASSLSVNGNSSNKNEQDHINTNYDSDSSSGSDASIPAVVPKKTPRKTPKKTSKSKKSSKVALFG